MAAPRFHVIRREAQELSDRQIEALMSFGRKEAEIVDAIEAAARAGNRERVWELAQQLCAVEDQVMSSQEDKK